MVAHDTNSNSIHPICNFFNLRFVSITVIITFGIIFLSIPKCQVFNACYYHLLTFMCIVKQQVSTFFIHKFLGYNTHICWIAIFLFNFYELGVVSFLWNRWFDFLMWATYYCGHQEGNQVETDVFTTPLLPSWRCTCSDMWTLKLLEKLHLAKYVFGLCEWINIHEFVQTF